MASWNNMGMVSLDDGLLVPSSTNLEDSFQSELERLLQEQRNQHIIEREEVMNMYRSGSAPPTVEGSLNAAGSLFRNSNYGEDNGRSTNANSRLTEDQIRSDPAYLSYYYSHQNINPRLPPPLMSKEDWRVAQRFQNGGSTIEEFGDWRKKSVTTNDGSSLFSVKPGLSLQHAENELMELRVANARNLLRQNSVQLLDTHTDGMTRLSGGGLGARRKSFANIVQEGHEQSSSITSQLSRPASCNSFRGADSTGTFDPHQSLSHNYGSTVGLSLSRGTTHDFPVAGKSGGPGLPPLGCKVFPIDKKSAIGLSSQNGRSSNVTEFHDIVSSLSGLNLSKSRNAEQEWHAQILNQGNIDNKFDLPLNMSHGHDIYIDLARRNELVTNLNGRKGSKEQVNLPRRTYSSANLYSKVNPLGLGSSEEPNVHHPSAYIATMDFSSHVPGTIPVDPKRDSMFENAALSAHGERQSQNHVNHIGANLNSAAPDPHFVPSIERTSEYSVNNLSRSSVPEMRSYSGNQYQDVEALQKAYLQVLLAQQMQQYELSHQNKSVGLNHGFYGNQLYGLGMPYSGNQFGSSGLTSVVSERPLFEDERLSHFTSMVRSSMGGSVGSRRTDIGNMEERSTSSLLDEFKNDKARSFELADIAGHVVHFSTDQYGSRFIQQKLELATEEEKNNFFREIIPHARTLMTDVFGNYVIQKIFEQGTGSQRKELASQLTGHVLPLSLQMYGCRVIQKALDVVDVDQQSAMVAELDGAVMKCVRDQNGNHVIQKSIECVPQDRIQFIVSSFYKQVVNLSTHPYGCRVIQRVLEHCDDPNTQQIIMDEIMQSVCTLAQDQYGNYVIQHVLRHGKPYERSAIINQLAGQIVKMSQQKFASNVVEKCLSYGSPEERQILVNEMLGTTDENQPLQAMMKDPFGNYVVQKVLETCDDHNLELILSRIKVHLNALKKYTYGKHIVSRVEKLITTGERRIGMLASIAS